MSANDIRIAADYLAGWTLRQLGKKYDLSHEGVRLALKRRGVEIRPRSYRSPTPFRPHSDYRRTTP